MSDALNPELAAQRERNFDPALERQKYAWMGYGALACGLLAWLGLVLPAGGLGGLMAFMLGKLLLDYPKSPLDTAATHVRKAELMRADPKPKRAAYLGMALGALGLLVQLASL